MQQILSHQGTKFALFGWGLFCTENLVLSENRTQIIDKLGLKTYRSIYGTFSTISMASIIYGYFKYPKGDLVIKSKIGGPRRFAGFVLQSLGLGLASQLFPNIMDKINKKQIIQQQIEDQYPQGVLKVTRHPSLYALGLFGLGASVMTPFYSRIAFGLLPFISVTILSNHQDSRFRRGMGGELTPEMDAKTSNFPFLAFLNGSQSIHEYLKNDFKVENFSAAVFLAFLLNLRRGRIV